MSTIFATPSYKVDDFQHIMIDVFDPRIILVKKDSDIKDFADFVARAKAQPGKLSVSATQGGAQELFAKWLFGKLGLQIRLVGYNGGSAAANAMLAGDVTAAIGDDSARFNLRDQTRALLVGAATKSARWPEAPVLKEAISSFGVKAPSDGFLARFGVYTVSAAFKAKYPAAYEKLQKALIDARQSPEFHAFVEKNRLQDLSIGKSGEHYAAAFEADLAEVAKLK
jgi:tripartite-type tricarboxylate transporter receptor subunit TctC